MENKEDLKRKFARMKKDELIDHIIDLTEKNRQARSSHTYELEDLSMLRFLYKNLNEVSPSFKKVEKMLKDNSLELQKTVEERTRELKLQKDQMEKSQKALTFLLEDVNESREEMAAINKKLEDANKELEAFSYSVSHDLKAPLRALDGFSQILLEDYEDKLDDDASRYLHLIRENSQQMGRLIQDLLDFSRVGRYELKIREVDMMMMVEEVKNDVMDIFNDQKIEFVIQKLPVVKTDKTMIRQVWQNLISNAAKFSREQDKARIEIGAESQEGKVRYFVKDNGSGFDMKYKPKLFNVFQRLHTQEEFEGTGVGLAIVKRIVKRLGGTVDAFGKHGDGACFFFELPLK
ncbi:MAG: ATP-binding protein [Bacteroidota bacterium]|nr:ATP-binding protein [Bacteroidota bacterium]